MIFAAAGVIAIVTIIVIAACYKATITSIEMGQIYLRKDKNNFK